MLVYLNIQRGFSAWPLIAIPERLNSSVTRHAYIVHEQTHYKRQRWWTPIWIARYFTSKAFRWQEEKLAYATEIKHLQTAGIHVDKNKYVEALVKEYWGMCTKEQAEDFVNGLLNQLREEHL